VQSELSDSASRNGAIPDLRHSTIPGNGVKASGPELQPETSSVDWASFVAGQV